MGQSQRNQYFEGFRLVNQHVCYCRSYSPVRQRMYCRCGYSTITQINVDFIESILSRVFYREFIVYYKVLFYHMDKKKLGMYTIVVFTKKQKQEEIILCAMYCGKKRNFYLIRQKH